MSTRVAMMDAGRILQLGTPDELYRAPLSLQVAQFIGSPVINLVPARIGKNGRVEFLGRPLALGTSLPEGASVTLGIRPEALQLATSDEPGPTMGAFPVVFRRSENLGAENILHFQVPLLPDVNVASRTIRTDDYAAPSDTTELFFPAAACHVFDHAGQRVKAVSERAEPASSAPKPQLAPGVLAS